MRTEARKFEIRNPKSEIRDFPVAGHRVVKGNEGFTLIEIVLVILVVGIMAAILIPALNQGVQGYSSVETRADLTSQARDAVTRMAREMRNIQKKANNTPNISSADATSITFVDAWNDTISFALSGNTVLRNTDTLVDQVSSLQFRYFDGSNNDLGASPSLSEIRRIMVVLILTEGSQTVSLTDQAFVRDLTGL